MKPINIYTVSRYCDEELFNIVEKHEATDRDTHKVRSHEIASLRILADALSNAGATVSEADGFYFGFTIPQIGKEFDLLKVAGKYCLNIELKSQDVGRDAMLAQLRKNRHYLTHLGKRLLLFTVNTEDLSCYRLTLSDNLIPVSIREIADALKKCDAPYDSDISKSFRASEYLISPMSNPDKFIQGKYFLTPAQDYVKSEVLKSIDTSDPSPARKPPNGCIFHITGRPGTGKTLLLYDIARTLAGNGDTAIIRCSALSEGEHIISREITNLTIMPVDELSLSGLSEYNFILVDESQCLHEDSFAVILDSVRQNDQICIFSSDPETILTTAEKERDIAGQIQAIPPAGEFELSERLRMNKELYTFIMTLKHLGYKSDSAYMYDSVRINYANDIVEAMKMISYFRRLGYVFINAKIPGEDDPFADLAEEFDVHHIIGREYDKVVMLMDSSFYYDEEGFLKGIPQPDPDYIYPNLFYQGITRVREHLALIILDAPELFRTILGIIS